MQFKYPELLWALLLLLIPIFIHLFQLRRFQKTPFTNVKFLKKVVSESRRSNTLKKWLLLITRLGLLTALILAFAQPFFAEESALKKKETVIYLDDSFSMQAKKEGASLLEDAVQSLLRSIPKDAVFTLFTNEQVFRNVSPEAIQNQLLALPYSTTQLTLEEIQLKAATFFSQDAATEKDLILLSDFQTALGATTTDSVNGIRRHLVQLVPDALANIAIDSAYIADSSPENRELVAELRSTETLESVPVSLFDNDTLIAKTAANFNEEKKARVVFTLPDKNRIKGKLEISDSHLAYDNVLYFNINASEKIKVLSVGNASHEFARRIYTEDEFLFKAVTLQNLNYGELAAQNLVILNELPAIPTALITNLKSFTENGGLLVIIPNTESDLNTYNALLSGYFASSFTEKIPSEKNITDIRFSHPLYRDVFEKKVVNFQYPKVANHYRIRTNAPTILSFQDGAPFLLGNGNCYFFTAAISKEHSNFSNSPLIVPTFYQMAVNSLQLPPIYTSLGRSTTLDINTVLPKDHILKLVKEGYEFIPLQRSLATKVSLSLDGQLREDGIYDVTDNDTVLSNLSFNHLRNESDLTYLNLNQIPAASRTTSIAELFDTIEKDNRITELWKWFIILALLLLLLEILIQKLVR